MKQVIQYNSYLCELVGPEGQTKTFYVPFWLCFEGAAVQDGKETWKVTKVIHQLYKVS